MSILICQYCDTEIVGDVKSCPQCRREKFISVNRKSTAKIESAKEFDLKYSELLESKYMEIALSHSIDKYKQKFKKILSKADLIDSSISQPFQAKKTRTWNWAALFGWIFWAAYRDMPQWKLITIAFSIFAVLAEFFPKLDRAYGIAVLIISVQYALFGNRMVLSKIRDGYISGVDAQKLRPSWVRPVLALVYWIIVAVALVLIQDWLA
jgi:hypothetical protein